jgi:hypothetical protein
MVNELCRRYFCFVALRASLDVTARFVSFEFRLWDPCLVASRTFLEVTNRVMSRHFRLWDLFVVANLSARSSLEMIYLVRRGGYLLMPEAPVTDG